MATAKLFLIMCIVVSYLAIPLELLPQDRPEVFFSQRGFSENNVGTDLAESFNQYEGSLTLMLPFQWQAPSSFWIKSGFDFTAGVLSGGGDDAFVGSAGPRISFRTPEETFSLDIGIAPTYIDSHEFGSTDFGGALQFTSFAGLYVHFLDRYRLGYRFQHMSNAGIYSENPGLNMHIFEVGLLF